MHEIKEECMMSQQADLGKKPMYGINMESRLAAAIGKDFHVKRLCPICKIFKETALELGHSLYMEMSPSSKNVRDIVFIFL